MYSCKHKDIRREVFPCCGSTECDTCEVAHVLNFTETFAAVQTEQVTKGTTDRLYKIISKYIHINTDQRLPSMVT
jgi:hypothetical protein